ncbi:hypothetical protein [Streptomyces sp. NBC_01537]|uniref:hypothetical protein n=1 Tax=Streptomyces sp. NBC_01537 TaxID=2903896 RepID=UPI003863DA9D
MVPDTNTGKKLEVPVKRILQGTEIEQVADRGSIDDPSALQRFAGYRAERARKGRVAEARR